MTKNIASGAVDGIVVSLVLGIYQAAVGHYQRQEQIQYVSEMVSSGIHRIHEEDNAYTKVVYYNILLRELEHFLGSEASSRIKYSEKRQLKTTFPYHPDGSVALLSHPPENPEDFFEVATEQFDSIEWLW